MPTINNYTFSDVTYVIEENADIATAVGASYATLTISPVSGFEISASDFSLDSSFSNSYVSSVTFAQNGVNVICTINFIPGVTMPSSNVTIPLCVVGQGELVEITISGLLTAVVGNNITGGSDETDTPYSNSGAFGSTELLFSRTYNASSGYYWDSDSIPTASIIEGNQSNYSIGQVPTYDSSSRLTNITFNVNYTYPNQSISGDEILITVPDTKEVYVSDECITNHGINTHWVPSTGITRTNQAIYGSEGADFSVVMTDTLGNTYNLVTNEVMGSSGVYYFDIEYPAIGFDVNNIYTITISGDICASANFRNPIQVIQQKQEPRFQGVEITFTGTSSNGITGYSDVTINGGYLSEPGEDVYAEIDWNLSVSSGSLAFNRSIIEEDFTNATFSQYIVNGNFSNVSTFNIDSTTSPPATGAKFNIGSNEGKAPFLFEVTGSTATSISVTPNITVSDNVNIFTFTNKGNVIRVGETTFTRVDVDTVNIKTKVYVDKFGTDDVTMTLDIDNILNVVLDAACATAITSASSGVADYNISLSSSGGLVAFLVDAQGVPDKFEIYHGDPTGGTKVSTTSHVNPGSGTSNDGPFDSVYGDESSGNVQPSATESAKIDQFIGTNITSPWTYTRESEFTTETGYTVNSMTVGSNTYQQVLWWEYSASDYNDNNFATLRVTGSTGTAWSVLRLCCPDANCT